MFKQIGETSKRFFSRAWDVPVYLGAGALVGSVNQRPSFGGFEDLALSSTILMWVFTNGGSPARLTRNAYVGAFGIAATAAITQPGLEAKLAGTGFAILSGLASYVMEKDHDKKDAVMSAYC